MAHVKRFLSDKFGQVDISHSIRVFMDPEDSPEPEAPRMRRASWKMPPPTDMLENKFSSSNRKRRWEDTPIPSQQVTVEIARSPLGTLAVVVEERFFVESVVVTLSQSSASRRRTVGNNSLGRISGVFRSIRYYIDDIPIMKVRLQDHCGSGITV